MVHGIATITGDVAAFNEGVDEVVAHLAFVVVCAEILENGGAVSVKELGELLIASRK